MIRRAAFLVALASIAGVIVSPVPAAAEMEVDLALVLAVDISWSMDPDEQVLQREGFIEAFRSPLVHDAIRKGMLGRVAVSYFEWANASHQQVIAPWTIIDGPEGAIAFADRLSRQPAGRSAYTSVSGAIDFGARMLAQINFEAARKVIDVSGDGANNDGRAVTLARDEAVADGLTINGLPIMLKRGGAWDIDHLDRYFQDCVIGGSGAFIVPVRERGHFAQAIKTKIIREIAGMADEPVVTLAQTMPPTNCMIGEILRQARIKSVAKAAAKKASVKGSGALNLEILWAGKPSNNNLPHYLTNARILLEQYGFKLNFNMNGDFQSSKLLDFQKDIVVSAAGNLDELAKVVVQRPEYKKGDSLVVVMGAARQHTDADKDDGGFRGICVGEEYGVTGNHFVLLNYNGTSPDGMTLLHEMTHAAGYHGHPGESGRKADTPRNVMTYGWRRNELDEEGLRKLNAAFFRKG